MPYAYKIHNQTDQSIFHLKSEVNYHQLQLWLFCLFGQNFFNTHGFECICPKIRIFFLKFIITIDLEGVKDLQWHKNLAKNQKRSYLLIYGWTIKDAKWEIVGTNIKELHICQAKGLRSSKFLEKWVATLFIWIHFDFKITATMILNILERCERKYTCKLDKNWKKVLPLCF